jgi:predicted acylesterase/phospholipase RssA
MEQVEEKYKHCMVMAGGGFCFGYYLGMYAAAQKAGRTPDILLASCGGSIAAYLIQALPTDEERKAWIASREMHAFWLSLRSSPKATIARTAWHALKRKWSTARAPKVADLFDDYFFDIPARLPLPAPAAQPQVAVAIVGGRLLYDRSDVGQRRQGRKLFEETIFCAPQTASLLTGMASPLATPEWGEHAIAPSLATDVQIPFADAARISISDMYYFPCVSLDGQTYTGGVVDLFPLEIAKVLAHSVTMEFKAPFDQQYAIPAWRAVLGLDGNQRLRYTHGQYADTWVDSSDVMQALAEYDIKKKLDWRNNRYRLAPPADYHDYARKIEAHWQYGYQRGEEAFARSQPNDKSTIRHLTSHNAP